MYWIDGEWLLIQVVEKLINSLEEFNKRSKGMFNSRSITSAAGARISDAGGEVTVRRCELTDEGGGVTVNSKELPDDGRTNVMSR